MTKTLTNGITPMTDLSTTNLKRLLAETSPGPWEALATYGNGAPRPDTTREMRAAGEYLGIMHTPNAALAAAAPELADEILRMRESWRIAKPGR